MFPPLSNPLRVGILFFTFPLPAPPSASLTVGIAIGGESGLPCSVQVTRMGRVPFVPRWHSNSVTRYASRLTPPLAFWLQPISIFGWSNLTRFINGSPELTLPSKPGPLPHDTCGYTFPSRFEFAPFGMGYVVPSVLHTVPLPVRHVRVGYRLRVQWVSFVFLRRNNYLYDFMSHVG